jgi:hypothetical protein
MGLAQITESEAKLGVDKRLFKLLETEAISACFPIFSAERPFFFDI